jgi:S1-C subfamily serine protease
MSTQRYQCPECDVTFTLKIPDSASETVKIRCPKCAAVFRVQTVDDPDESTVRAADPDDRPARRQRPSEDERNEERRRASRHRDAVDDDGDTVALPSRNRDDDDRPSDRKRRDSEKRPARKKSRGLFSLRNIIILTVFAAASVVGIIVFHQQQTRSDEPKKDKPSESASVPPAVDGNPPPIIPGGQNNQPEFRAKLPPADDVNRMVPREPHVPAWALDPGKIDDDVEPPPLPKDLDRETIDRVKRATVYVRVRMADDRDASGTGFFEATSGLLITNAHVIDMLRDGPPPKQIEIILHSGEGSKKERTFLADAVAVDRESDVAVLRPRGQGAKAKNPAGLTIAPSKQVNLLQPVFVFGFPLGEGLGKDITASATSVSSLRRDPNGELAQIQVNGGMHSGNSGGPVVNTKGQVVGVAVSVIKGTQINFAIPGDRVHDLLRGRMDHLEVRDANPRGKDIPVRIGLRSSDPLDHIVKSGVDWWIGGPEMDVPGSLSTGMKLPAKLTKRTLALTYNGNGRLSEGEVLLSPAPLAGQVLWLQPWTTYRSGLTVYAAGLKHAVDVPPDPQPITLRYAPPASKQPLEITSKASFRLAGLLGEDRSLRMNLFSKLNEQTRERKATGETLTHFAVEKINVTLAVDERLAPPSAEIQRVNQHMSAVDLFAETDTKGGHIYSYANVDRVPADARPSIEPFSEQVQKSLQVMMVTLPAEQIQPGHTWKAFGVVPGIGLSRFERTQMEMSFKYLGIRPAINGKKLAVISISDAVDGSMARGKILVDIVTGRVMLGRLEVATALRMPFEDDEVANGSIEIQLTRLRD